MISTKLNVWRQCAWVLVAAALIPLEAQTQPQLEEILVTSQKREQSLSTVPISVNVMSGEKLTSEGITNLNDLSDLIPNLSLNQTGVSTNFAIRGISSGINAAFEQSVGLYVDDIYYGRAQLARVPYLDVERVEVLRGPQPILFGKNAIAGAISTITRRADLEGIDGYVQTDYNFDQEGYDAQGAVNIPLSDTLAVRLAGLRREQGGYYENTAQNRRESQLDQSLYRINLHYEPNDNLNMDFKYERTDFHTDGRFAEIVNPEEIGGSPTYATVLLGLTDGAVVLDTEQDFRRQTNGGNENTELDNATFHLNYALGSGTLTATSGFVQYDYYLRCDCDFTSAVIIDVVGQETFDQFSQDLRYSSPGDETVDYIVGAFYQSYDLSIDEITMVPDGSLLGNLSAALPGTGARRDYGTDSELWSVYAQVTWNISDTLRLNVGGRYTGEDKTGFRIMEIVDITDSDPVRDITGQAITTSAVAPQVYAGGLRIASEQTSGHNLNGDRNESAFTPALNLQWNVNDDIMLYTSYTEGFKAGGFDTRANNTGSFEFEEEEATAYELGAKMSLAGGAAELNAALYRTGYDSLQTSQYDGVVGFNVTNVGKATIQGLEVDGRWQATGNLLITGSAGWLDFNFDSFPNSQCYFGETPDYDEGPFAGLCNRTGDVREFTPELTYSLGGVYQVSVSDTMELSLGLDLFYSDEYFVAPTLDPKLKQDSYFKLNGRIGLAANDGVWDVALVIENITDEAILNFGNTAPVSTTLSRVYNGTVGASGRGSAYYGFYDAPFNLALQARYSF